MEFQGQTPAMIKHAMHLSYDITNKLNKGRSPVLTMVQSLYTLGKQLHKQHEDLGECKIVSMLCGLRIEMLILTMIGHLIDASGCSEAIIDAEIITYAALHQLKKDA